MGWWLCDARGGQASDVLTRFDARFWTVDFPRPMMASVVTTAHDGLRVDAVFYQHGDLAGLIWESADRWDHPLLRYETRTDYRDCTLRFRWRSGGVVPLDQIHGPTLTIEGRDAEGTPKAWYVRLWNYAVGTPEDAVVSIDFATVVGGYMLPEESDPVWAGDIDRMFVSLVPPGYMPGSEARFAAGVEGWVEVSELACEGPGSVLELGDAVVPEHGLRIAGGYDDSYNQTPARLLRNAYSLGYRGDLIHYVGMSHYFRLAPEGEALLVSAAGGALNGPCAAWHRDFFARAAALDYRPVVSLSYELFDAHCWGDWKQRDHTGAPALTGWAPPSSLLSPAHGGAMAYLQGVARAFCALAGAAGLPIRFQVGEPWWWTNPGGRICLYDAAAAAALPAHPPIPDIRAATDAAQRAALDAAGALLAASTAALVDAVRQDHAGMQSLLLVYLPTVLDATAPDARRANVPVGWASPAFDVLQLEDYDWVVEERTVATARGVAATAARLGYPIDRQHYFSGFVLRPDQAGQWRAIARAAEAARARGTARTFVWALPQVVRDGFVHWDEEEDAVDAFDDVDFPLSIGREAQVAPAFSTAIVTSASGAEARNADWAQARTRYDAGPGVRSEEDIAALLGFFRARLGPARGFRFRDPFDWRSGGGEPAATDQAIGTGDGVRARFALTKAYGAQARRITRPVPGSVRVAIDGVAIGGWTLEPGGFVAFDAPPASGAAVTAGYLFDVPVRFAEDVIEVNRATFLAGEAPSVPLIEIREA